jgi:hypothetical protein
MQSSLRTWKSNKSFWLPIPMPCNTFLFLPSGYWLIVLLLTGQKRPHWPARHACITELLGNQNIQRRVSLCLLPKTGRRIVYLPWCGKKAEPPKSAPYFAPSSFR